MRPLDPRLLRFASATRRFLVISVVLGVVDAILLIAQASLLASVISSAVLEGAGFTDVRGELIVLVMVALTRAGVAWLSEWSALRSAVEAKSQLRAHVLDSWIRSDANSLLQSKKGDTIAIMTRGIDVLDAYFSRYLSQLVLACLVPALLLVRLAWVDLLSAITIAITLPLIPVFMILVGRITEQRMNQQFRSYQRLAGHFLEIVRGLPTLRAFGRGAVQVEGIASTSEHLRKATMANLRIAFLSSFVLELLSTIGVALVAVSIGFRLVDSRIGFETALLVLFLTPEVYVPLRQVGAQFHANKEGMTAAEAMFEIIERPRRSTNKEIIDLEQRDIDFDDVSFTFPGANSPVFSHFSACVPTGKITAVAGASGAGKSTLLALILGFLSADDGVVSIGKTNLEACRLEHWRNQIAWVPQRPHILSASIYDNIRFGADASIHEVRRAAELACATSFIDSLSGGFDTLVGEKGEGLSAGQRQRLSLARAFLRDRPVMLLDEPTAHLDVQTEADVIANLEGLAHGRTVLIVTHSDALLKIADEVINVGGVLSDA